MKTIGDLLARDLGQKIEEIVKVSQADEETVYREITEYVATDRIKEQYRNLLRAIAEAPSEPHEGVGVWISGFFGSGKSYFAKNLGYILANRQVLGRSASELFKTQVNDRRISELVDFVNVKIPTEVVMFDVSVDRAVRRTTERIAEIMYTVLLRELGYAEDYDIAELEIELEKEGRLDEFMECCRESYGDWTIVRKGAQKIARASAILYAMDPTTYPTPDSWAQTLRDRKSDITVGGFVERTFELCARRRPGKAVVFIIDEVGQYVARSADKIEDLRAVVEQFGKASKNMLKAKKAVGPVWVIVTSQEKLEEVVAAIDSKRVELAKLQDRFKYRIDLAPADIREVATRRVLVKKDEAVGLLSEMYRDSQGQLNAACRLERTARTSEITEDDFIQFYPYLPHFVELSIDIMSGIRLQPGAPRHLGGSNRTIIKQAYEMLVSERTGLASKPVGTLVTLDKIFELVEGNLSDERRKDISDIAERFDKDPDDKGMAARVAKAICLLEFVRDLPRTETNIAACLVDEVGRASPVAEVEKALKKLEEAQFVRATEEGWKLQTAQEKNWDTERRGYLSPKPRERNEILRNILEDIFSEPQLKTYRFRGLRNFRVGIRVDGTRVGDEGQVPLSVVTAEDPDAFAGKLEEVRAESRNEEHRHDLYWVFPLNAQIDDLIANLHASQQMVAKYDQLRAQNRITSQEASCLQDEKNRVIRLRGRLRTAVLQALQAGTGLFQGVAKDGSALGKTAPEIFKRLFDWVVPDLYPKLEMAARPLKGTEAEEILKAANLSGLSQVFYEGEEGLGLVVHEGGKYVVNTGADVAKEVLDYLTREHAYGNKETRTGKALETHFSGIGYGWDRDTLRLILAALFRTGAIEVSYRGQRFDSYTDPRSREPFTSNIAFKSALFTPVKAIDLQTLTKAVENYEVLSGRTVDVDKNAIATEMRKLASEELELLLPLEALVKAHELPFMPQLEDYRSSLTALRRGTAEECVQILVGEGKSLKEARDRIREMREALDDEGIATYRRARVAVNEMWPLLRTRVENAELAAAAEELTSALASEMSYRSRSVLRAKAEAIRSAYRQIYEKLHAKRAEEFSGVVEEIKGRPDWLEVPEEMRKSLLAPLAARGCDEMELRDDATTCRKCRATIAQMESDLAALSALKAQVVARIQQVAAPTDKVERVALAQFFTEGLDSEEAVDIAVERLREHLLKLIAAGVRIILE